MTATVKPVERARREAWALVMAAAGEALAVPGLSPDDRRLLGRVRRGAASAACQPLLRPIGSDR